MKAVSAKYETITKRLIETGTTITTMESCTAGLLASLITDTEGSSAIIKGACVTYSNDAKVMEGVPGETIDKYGVYSEETARAMATACQKKYGADIGIGVTGSFGNVDPNNSDSVPGEVYYAIALKDRTLSFHGSIPSRNTRLDYKLYMADMIADSILEIIK